MFKSKIHELNYNGGTMKSSLVLAMLLVITLVIPFTSAVTGIEDTLKITVYKISNTSTTITYSVNFTTTQFPKANDKGLIFTVYRNHSLKDLADGAVVSTSGDFGYLALGEVENINYVERWATCKEDLLKANVAWQNCHISYELPFKDQNTTACKEDLSACRLDLKMKDVDVSTKNDKITSLQQEIEGKKNLPWIWAIGGVIVGILGLLVYQGKLGQRLPKERAMGEFSRSQAG